MTNHLPISKHQSSAKKSGAELARPGSADGMSKDALKHGGKRMQLRYGFNEIDGWWHLSTGGYRDELTRRIRLMDTKVIRIFVFDQPVPNPLKDWPGFVAYIQGVLDAGAIPMLTFAKFPPPYDNDHNVKIFAARCREVVWGCVEQWGGDVVKDWYWCVWNEPNNLIIGGDLTYEMYQHIYEAVAVAINDALKPFLNGAKPMIGGPAIDGTHRSYWMDWIVRLVTEVDNDLIGFVSWHRYGDWRPAVPSATLDLEMWGAPDPPNGKMLEDLLMAQTPSYEARARGVARLLHNRDILNVCGELNTIAHHEHYYTLGVNQNLFGGAYYASALIHLIRGGAELEMRWTAIGHGDAYGLLSIEGEPTVAALIKQIFVQHVRYGDEVCFFKHRQEMPHIDGLISYGANGRISGVFVNTSRSNETLQINEWDEVLMDCTDLIKLDNSTGKRIARSPFDGQLQLDGYGVAIISNEMDETVID